MQMHGRGRAAAAALTVMLALAAGACGGDDDDTSSGDDPSGSESTADDAADGGGTETTLDFGEDEDYRGDAAEGEHPCDVVDGAALDALVGAPLGDGQPAVAGVSENDIHWSAAGCKWEIEDRIEMQVHLVQADDYEAGEVVCPELSDMVSTVTAVPGLGESAQWRYNDSGTEGELRACTSDGMVTAKVELEEAASLDEATLKSLTTELVEPVVPLI